MKKKEYYSPVVMYLPVACTSVVCGSDSIHSNPQDHMAPTRQLYLYI